MIITSLATLMTAGDLWELPDDGTLYELSQGKLIRMSRSAYGPSKISGRVLVRIGSFVDQHNLGDYGTAEGGFRLESDPDTVRAPDVWFVRAENAPREPPERGFWRGRPDLAVEVLSPSDRFEQVMRKVRDYLAAGVPLVWGLIPRGAAAASSVPAHWSPLWRRMVCSMARTCCLASPCRCATCYPEPLATPAPAARSVVRPPGAASPPVC